MRTAAFSLFVFTLSLTAEARAACGCEAPLEPCREQVLGTLEQPVVAAVPDESHPTAAPAYAAHGIDMSPVACWGCSSGFGKGMLILFLPPLLLSIAAWFGIAVRGDRLAVLRLTAGIAPVVVEAPPVVFAVARLRTT